MEIKKVFEGLARTRLPNFDNIQIKDVYEFGFFRLGKYNECLSDFAPMQLKNHGENSVCCLFINKPNMFEDGFVRQIKNFEDVLKLDNPFDSYTRNLANSTVNTIKDALKINKVKFYHDEDFNPMTMLPFVHLQKAAELTHTCSYYHSKKFENVNFFDCDKFNCLNKVYFTDSEMETNRNKKVGVAIHQKYSGYVSFSGLLVMDELNFSECTDLVEDAELDLFKDNERVKRLIHAFAVHWQDGSYRDFYKANKKHSYNAMTFFSSPRDKRKQELKKILDSLQIDADRQQQ